MNQEHILILFSLQYAKTSSLILKTWPITTIWGEKFLIVFKILSFNFFVGLNGCINDLLDLRNDLLLIVSTMWLFLINPLFSLFANE